jgi:sodium/potassium-transporting ATPase subunit alpha
LSNLEWHILAIEELSKRLATSEGDGLTTEEVQRRLVMYGKNALSPLPTRWFWQIFGYFFKGFGSILLVGAILVFASWKPLGEPPAVANLALAIVLVAVFFIQAAFNAWQDWSSSRVMASITAMLPESCLLIRNGNQVHVPTSDVVPGDILIIKSGNKLPADVRFVEVSSDATFDRSILTGMFVPYKTMKHEAGMTNN